LTEEDFYRALRMTYEYVRDCALMLKPGATIFLEKTPENSFHTDLIDRLAPECHFVHIIRDPWDVAASVLTAGRTWARGWALTAADRAARLYRRHVEHSLKAAKFSDRYHEVRFEGLVSQPVEGLMQLFIALEIDSTEQQCREIVDEVALDRSRSAQAIDPNVFGGEAAKRLQSFNEPKGFFGTGTTGRGRRELSTYDQWCVARETHHLAARFGYEMPRAPAAFEQAAYASCRILGRIARGVHYAAEHIRGLVRDSRA
jgi:hypothetical protein